MLNTDRRITSIVSRVALLVALVVALALPSGYWLIAYHDLSEGIAFKAKVKATALAGLVAANPDVWMFAENRLLGLLTREPVPLETELVEVYDDQGSLLAQVGETPMSPVLKRTRRRPTSSPPASRRSRSGSSLEGRYSSCCERFRCARCGE